MWAAATKPFVQFQFRRHTTTSLLPILLMANQASLSFSSGSPVHAPLKRVGTHNGSFHCDEALGCFMIRLTNKFNSAEIVRSRDPQVRFSFSISLFSFLFIYLWLGRRMLFFLFGSSRKYGIFWGLVNEKKGFFFFVG